MHIELILKPALLPQMPVSPLIRLTSQLRGQMLQEPSGSNNFFRRSSGKSIFGLQDFSCKDTGFDALTIYSPPAHCSMLLLS